MNKAFILLALAPVISSTAGCDFFESLTKTTQAVSILTRTPQLSEASGMDLDLLTALSAGGVLAQLDDGATSVIVGIGERDDAWSIQTPTPVEDADVLLGWGGYQVAVCPTTTGTAGTYSASSLADADCGDPTLTYVENETYTTNLAFEDVEAYLEVDAPTAADPDVVSFSPALSAGENHYGATLPTHDGGALTVDWSNDSSASSRPAIITVFHLQFTGSAATDALVASSWTVANNPVHTDMPDTPKEMIDIILLDEPPTSTDIPSSVFASRGLYFLVLTSAELSETYEQVSIGSGALAGVGTSWAFWVD